MALIDDHVDGEVARVRLAGQQITAPALIDLEVMSVLRGLVRSGQVTPARAALAIDDLAAIPLTRAAHAPLLLRSWELRDNLTPYDAAYVPLAEVLGATLVTGDRRFGRASGPRCSIEVLAVSR